MNSSNKGKAIVVPKEEILDFDLPPGPGPAYSRLLGYDAPSSSGSNVKSNLLNMGFSQALVDKVLEEKGEEDVELLVETLLSLEKSDSRSSDSLDGLFDDNNESSLPQISSVQVKEEPDELDDGKKAYLLNMNFSTDEVEIAIDSLGEDATINDLVDFILASRISAELENNTDDITHCDEVKEETSDELYGIMEKTIRLLEIGFSENEISLAMENLGAGTPLGELADAISGGHYIKKKVQCSSSRNSLRNGSEFFGTGPSSVKLENEGFFSAATQSRELAGNSLGKRPKQECVNVSQFRAPNMHHENHREKRPKHEFVNRLSPSPWVDEKVDPEICDVSILGRENQKKVKPPPYFFFGNVVNLEHNSWAKISHYLYECKPEFVNSRFFSALDRREWYIHNLPTENRFHVMPESIMTIQDAMPHTRKLWPSWDTRKQLTCINSETNSSISQLCDRLGRMVSNRDGLPSLEEQRQILHLCSINNLVWVGRNKLGPLDLERLERILGYPSNHTKVDESGSFSRLTSLKNCFQIETLAYHLSSLKSMYPEGLTLFSMFSGLGGAEIALHKLGIPLKGVVFVETCATKRKIFRNWWESTRQRGQLEQFDDIQKLTTKKFEILMNKFGGFDLLICHSPCSDLESSDPSINFSLFYEFVRVFQRVRGMMNRRE